MAKQYKLYWMRETGCDAGTPIDAEELDAPIRNSVLALTGEKETGVEVHLPFLDRREWRRRGEMLRDVRVVREGSVIRCVPSTVAGRLRDRAAELIAMEPAWKNVPGEMAPQYFRTWQRVSLALQTALRAWIPERYFWDAARYADREDSYALIVYQASRRCYGRPSTEFTYDVADPQTVPRVFTMIGRATQEALAPVEQRLHDAGQPELARRYAPVWYQDVLRAVRKEPRKLITLLGDEAALINAVIELGTQRRMEAVKPFAKAASAALRSVHGEDMRELSFRVLDEATRVLRLPISRPPPAA